MGQYFKSASKIINNYKDHKEVIDRIALSGHSIFLYSKMGPKFAEIHFDEKWQAEYSKKKYIAFDPVVSWCRTQKGYTRLSEIKITFAKMDIFKRSAKYGINYGCAFSTEMYGYEHYFTAARPDREMEDHEIDSLYVTWIKILETLNHKLNLSEDQIKMLTLLRNGTPVKNLGHEFKSFTGKPMSERTVHRRLDILKERLNADTIIELIGNAVAHEYID